MKTTLLFALLFVLNMVYAAKSYSNTPIGYKIVINGNGYSGRIGLSGSNEFIQLSENSPDTITLLPNCENTYFLNNGLSAGDCNLAINGYIFITFNSTGKIQSICPKAAASIGKDSLSIRLNIVKIKVDPKKYKLNWSITCQHFPNVEVNYFNDKTEFSLIKGLTYAILFDEPTLETCCNGGCTEGKHLKYSGSFLFNIDTNGNLFLNTHDIISAKIKGNTLKFNTTKLSLNPKEVSNGNALVLNNGKETITFQSKKKYHFVKSVVSYVSWVEPDGSKGIRYFLPI